MRSFAQKKVIFRLQLTENSSMGFLLYAKSNVTSSLKNVVNVSLHGATVYRISQLVENIQSRFSVKLIRTWGDSELPSLPLFKCLTLILFAIMCRCQGRIPCGISALCQVYMLFIVYQDFDKWEGSAMAGTLDYSPPVDHIEPSRSSGYY